MTRLAADPKRLPAGSTMGCEDVAVPPSATPCIVCRRLRLHGSFSDSGDVFVCTGCQADAKQFIEIQDSLWAEIADTGGSGDAANKPPKS